MSNKEYPIKKTETEWKEQLSPEEFHILRKKEPNAPLPESLMIIMKMEFTPVKDVDKPFMILLPNLIVAADGLPMILQFREPLNSLKTIAME